MKKYIKRNFCISICFLTAFALWTTLLHFIDVQAIGPQESSVGFATLNAFFHNLTGTHMVLYTITDWLGLVPLLIVFGFALLGLIQWIQRKSILKVDASILILGIFYFTVFAVFILFENLIVNYRPVLINGVLEASYPSSTTLLAMCVMPTALLQLRKRIKNNFLRICICIVISFFTLFMVIGRLISGVHWFSDIIGGALLSCGLVIIYDTFCQYVEKADA